VPDDLRTRHDASAAPVEPEVAPDEVEEGPSPTPEEAAAIQEAYMVEIRQQVADLKAGRIVAVPWDEAMNARIFGSRR
jgi:hypothetical protein